MIAGLVVIIVLLLIVVVLQASCATLYRANSDGWRENAIRWHDAHDQLVWELAERDATIARHLNTIDELRDTDEAWADGFAKVGKVHRVE